MRRVVVLVVLAALLVSGAGPGRDPAGASVAVVTRVLPLARGADRPLPTTLWYPAGLTGRHPVVLFSHGLGGLPGHFASLLASWARAGYVVAAPAYPHTNGRVTVDRRDIANQPADAAYVLSRVLALDLVPGEALAGHLAAGRTAAVGFSAGGTTTLGMFAAGHAPGLRAGISIAGRRPPVPFGGPPAALLFLHGDRDRVVPLSAGLAAWEVAPGPRHFVSISGGGHGEYLRAGDDQYAFVAEQILAFLAGTVPTA